MGECGCNKGKASCRIDPAPEKKDDAVDDLRYAAGVAADAASDVMSMIANFLRGRR